MTQLEIKNHTPFAHEAMLLSDENFAPLVTVVVKATYDIASATHIALAEEQEPVCIEGEYWGDPESSSYKYEPETAFFKPTTDIVMIGCAYAGNDSTEQMLCGIRIGNNEKVVRIFGDRYWDHYRLEARPSTPKPITELPLRYEYAFGGRDPRVDSDKRTSVDARNSIGVGFCDPSLGLLPGSPLPNIEDPACLIKHYRDTPAPAGFGYLLPHWQPRASCAGTYDKTWDLTRKPLLPADFDRRFFNGASAGLIADRYLVGGEAVKIMNASKRGTLEFNLPNLQAPLTRFTLEHGDSCSENTRLDTVIINCDEDKLFLLWRSCLSLPYGHDDIKKIDLYHNETTTYAAIA